MVRACVDAAYSVGASGQASRDICRQDAILSRGVETLEEREIGRVQGFSRFKRRKRLNDHMAVTFDVPVAVDGLQKGAVSEISH